MGGRGIEGGSARSVCGSFVGGGSWGGQAVTLSDIQVLTYNAEQDRYCLSRRRSSSTLTPHPVDCKNGLQSPTTQMPPYLSRWLPHTPCQVPCQECPASTARGLLLSAAKINPATLCTLAQKSETSCPTPQLSHTPAAPLPLKVFAPYTLSNSQSRMSRFSLKGEGFSSVPPYVNPVPVAGPKTWDAIPQLPQLPAYLSSWLLRTPCQAPCPEFPA